MAKELLTRFLEDAAAEGYEYAEVYPQMSDGFSIYDFTGAMELYRSFGFEEAGRREQAVIMRKPLKGTTII